MRPVTFRFDLDKLVHTLAFFSRQGVNDLTKLKAAKLIYFVDKHHLWHFGRPVVGGAYYCMPFGPVPGKALQAMNDVIDAAGLPFAFGVPAERVIEEYLEVREDGVHPRFVARKDFDPDVFSKSELEALGVIVQKFGQLSASQLVELTHRDPTWTKPNQTRAIGGRESIPYELFFENASEDVRQVWDLITSEQAHQETDEPLPADLVA
jgi:uncharacterized phage-associated protein